MAPKLSRIDHAAGSVLIRLDQQLAPLQTRSYRIPLTASPAKAGVHRPATREVEKWVPASAGTAVWDAFPNQALKHLAKHA